MNPINAERQPKSTQPCCQCGQNLLRDSIIFKATQAKKVRPQKERTYVTAGMCYTGITTRATDEKIHAERLAVMYEWMSLFEALEPWR